MSISRETTFDRDLHAVHDRAELGHHRLCERWRDLQRKGYTGRTIGKLRYADFRGATRDQTDCPSHA